MPNKADREQEEIKNKRLQLEKRNDIEVELKLHFNLKFGFDGGKLFWKAAKQEIMVNSIKTIPGFNLTLLGVKPTYRKDEKDAGSIISSKQVDIPSEGGYVLNAMNNSLKTIMRNPRSLIYKILMAGIEGSLSANDRYKMNSKYGYNSHSSEEEDNLSDLGAGKSMLKESFIFEGIKLADNFSNDEENAEIFINPNRKSKRNSYDEPEQEITVVTNDDTVQEEDTDADELHVFPPSDDNEIPSETEDNKEEEEVKHEEKEEEEEETPKTEEEDDKEDDKEEEEEDEEEEVKPEEDKEDDEEEEEEEVKPEEIEEPKRKPFTKKKTGKRFVYGTPFANKPSAYDYSVNYNHLSNTRVDSFGDEIFFESNGLIKPFSNELFEAASTSTPTSGSGTPGVTPGESVGKWIFADNKIYEYICTHDEDDEGNKTYNAIAVMKKDAASGATSFMLKKVKTLKEDYVDGLVADSDRNREVVVDTVYTLYVKKDKNCPSIFGKIDTSYITEDDTEAVNRGTVKKGSAFYKTVEAAIDSFETNARSAYGTIVEMDEGESSAVNMQTSATKQDSGEDFWQTDDIYNGRNESYPQIEMIKKKGYIQIVVDDLTIRKTLKVDQFVEVNDTKLSAKETPVVYRLTGNEIGQAMRDNIEARESRININYKEFRAGETASFLTFAMPDIIFVTKRRANNTAGKAKAFLQRAGRSIIPLGKNNAKEAGRRADTAPLAKVKNAVGKQSLGI